MREDDGLAGASRHDEELLADRLPAGDHLADGVERLRLIRADETPRNMPSSLISLWCPYLLTASDGSQFGYSHERQVVDKSRARTGLRVVRHSAGPYRRRRAQRASSTWLRRVPVFDARKAFVQCVSDLWPAADGRRAHALKNGNPLLPYARTRSALAGLVSRRSDKSGSEHGWGSRNRNGSSDL